MLSPYNIRCYFCGKPIRLDDIVLMFDSPNGKPAVAHTYHHGVKEYLMKNDCQLTSGDFLLAVAENVKEDITMEKLLRD